MKNYHYLLLTFLIIFPININAQNKDSETATAVIGGIAGIAAGIAAVQQLKEGLELKAVEEILFTYPNMLNFELKTSTLKGTKAKDLSSVGVVTFEITDFKDGKRYVLFSFLSSGWSNQYGFDYEKIKWKLFDRDEWNHLMQAFVKTASRQDVSLDQISKSKFGSKGLKVDNKYIIEFSKLRGDMYSVVDYSDEFKVIFNEQSMTLYLKGVIQDIDDNSYRRGGVRGDLVQIKNKAVIRAHEHLNYIMPTKEYDWN